MDAMDTATVIYDVLVAGCVLSCLGGPITMCRWLSVPFHLLFGAILHAAAIFILYSARHSDAGEACWEQGQA